MSGCCLSCLCLVRVPLYLCSSTTDLVSGWGVALRISGRRLGGARCIFLVSISLVRWWRPQWQLHRCCCCLIVFTRLGPQHLVCDLSGSSRCLCRVLRGLRIIMNCRRVSWKSLRAVCVVLMVSCGDPCYNGARFFGARWCWNIRAVSHLVSLPGYLPQGCHRGTCHFSVCCYVHRLFCPGAVQEVSRDIVCHHVAQGDCGQIGEAPMPRALR